LRFIEGHFENPIYTLKDMCGKRSQEESC
jgi:hypothetical protein